MNYIPYSNRRKKKKKLALIVQLIEELRADLENEPGLPKKVTLYDRVSLTDAKEMLERLL